ncbi:tyrosine protein kinase, putative [Pediculus humanus corporis]|uniref:Gamma-aminobutyric acid type B receptor subunit 2 n=1 Tax=Pediculus humanus subsp. corporis TaxID=121224 RepID=E0VCP0_PEDHC|nr:tyrosine protein kinase, putative [Pediculus humanus corporis]EEB11146.1 tyrosine protein kinase, putative [Pediculus humanus corporis]
MLLPQKVLFLCHLASMLFGFGSGKCLTHLPEVNPKWFYTVDGKRCSIIIESSERIAHNITSNIFKIFLDEVIGYDSVEIVQRKDYFNSTLALSRLQDKRAYYHSYYNDTLRCPVAAINLEIWITTYESLKEEIYQKKKLPPQLGSVAPPGRFGWFIPKKFSNSALDSIHWKVFQNKELAQKYGVDETILETEIREFAIDPETKNYFCPSPICEDGVFVMEKCQSRKGRSPCAMLFAGHYDVTKFVIEDIKSLDLFVSVIWLGPNLKNVTSRLIENRKDQPVVILSWTPSIITASGEFVSVVFPPCQNEKPLTPGCNYELQRLVKSTSRTLAQGARQAWEAVNDMYFSDSQYRGLLKDYLANLSLSHQDIACNWMKTHQSTWKHWTQVRDNNELKILGIFPFSGSSYNGAGVADAAEMAVDAINRNTSILRDITLVIQKHDGQCNTDVVMNKFIETVLEKNEYQKLIGILGPACSDTVESLIGACKYFRTVAISYSAEGTIFSDRSKYPYFFRTIGENQEYNLVYLNLLKRLGWKRISSITEDGQKYTEYLPHLVNLLSNYNFTFVANSKFPRIRVNHTMKSYLEDLKSKSARIIIADVYDPAARSVMCAAYQLKMTAVEGYVWFLPQWLNQNWYNTDEINPTLNVNERVECSTAQMIEAINGYFSLAHSYYAPDDAIMQENITVGEWREKYANETAFPSDYGGFAYDAVWVYALAIDKLYQMDPFAVAQLHSEKYTEQFVEIIQNTDFNGVSGRIKFVSGASRMTVIDIVQWVNNKTRIVGSFHPNSSGSVTDHRFELNVSAIVWLTLDGKQPGDGAETCILQALADLMNVDCSVAVVVANVMGISLFGILVIIAFIIIKHRYDKKMQKIQKTQELMKSLGFDLLAPNLDSDKWEIPRDRLVINRKLGEGAFGTVYGGEAYFSDKGWVAAAVKALKVNSTTEQKLDFLSEAEVMKKFDHKNIVKLLGVCTKQEPVYTVMEFMLYGDLKTFLLARRHLVNNKKIHEESDEISSKKLTAMALDVARGLSYLAQLKYVHRDIACRNCLINYARVVKIGDFGMTRSMFENDYYKFTRKGMMPVRWMAPESLALGIFTPSSDVWSFGVLLYEIITFGSFPFQGLSNNEVVKHVNKGNTITIPSGIKPQLECLIKSCWNLEYKKRPQASEIVEFLANNPRLISPCLDVPISSVEFEDTGQLELNLPKSLRKFSLTLNAKYEESAGETRNQSLSQDSEPSPPPAVPPTSVLSDFDEPSSVFFPNGYAAQTGTCPWMPLLNPSSTSGGNHDGSSRSSSITAGLGKLVTIHKSESCDECLSSHEHQTSVL